MNFIQGFDRNQLQMLSYNSFVKQDSWARIVDLFVDILPLEDLGFIETMSEEGRPSYPLQSQKTMFTLFKLGVLTNGNFIKKDR